MRRWKHRRKHGDHRNDGTALPEEINAEYNPAASANEPSRANDPMPKNTILLKMLDRLFAGLASGPNLNCRPHSSRQRVDWMQLSKLQDLSPGQALCQLLSEKQATQVRARVSTPRLAAESATRSKRSTTQYDADIGPVPVSEGDRKSTEDTPEQRLQQLAWSNQQALLAKLRALAEDARDYEQDTGAHVLHVGFPLLSLPTAGSASAKPAPGGSKRLLAPIAFIPVKLDMRAGPTPVVAIEGLHDGAQFLVPNEALFAWLERQTGQSVLPDLLDTNHRVETTPTDVGDTAANGVGGEPDRTESAGSSGYVASLNPWVEVNDLIRRVTAALHLPACELTPESINELRPAPRGDEEEAQAEIVPAAVLGLFPMNNQSLLRDMQAMVSATDLPVGPVQSFMTTASLQEESTNTSDEVQDPANTRSLPNPVRQEPRSMPERLITVGDPCQALAVRLARECQGLVIHGPPGTGKSQTITNIIGDHLARGERVLMVCDKRTALDVVVRRLEHLRLGSLCALIHDPQHDQRELYRQVREQLEGLSQTAVDERADGQLKTLDRQLAKLNETFGQAWSLVMSRDPHRHVSFHERMGEWLATRTVPTEPLPKDDELPEADRHPSSASGTASARSGVPIANQPQLTAESVEQLDSHISEIRDIAIRAIQIDYAKHPWGECARMPLATFLANSAPQIHDKMDKLVGAASALDATEVQEGCLKLTVADGSAESAGETPSHGIGFAEQITLRRQLATQLRRCLLEVLPALRQKWGTATVAAIKRARPQFDAITSCRNRVQSQIQDPELAAVTRTMQDSVVSAPEQTAILRQYSGTCDAWYSWLFFGNNRRAKSVIRSYGLVPGKESALRLLEFTLGIQARHTLRLALDELCRIQAVSQEPHPSNPRDTEQSHISRFDDSELLNTCEHIESLLAVLELVTSHPALTEMENLVRQSLVSGDQSFIEALSGSLARADALQTVQAAAVGSGMFRPDWINRMLRQAAGGRPILPEIQQLAVTIDSLGEVLKIQAKLDNLPAGLRSMTDRAISTATDVETVIRAVRHETLSGDIRQWLNSNPQLQSFDGGQLTNLGHEIHRLDTEKQTASRDFVLNLWVNRQRERLLASTGSRLNSLGADLRRRLTSRGERAMRLRQVIAAGQKIDGGDPLFDLRPVWMASPETVAQIFPRMPLFDVVIFDEASQCRLEEALPVLTRAKRVVIAGDPKQLPPTRFFESAVVTSENGDIDADQELFEAQQSEVEDLLTAALSLDLQESHLDVHYRSRNAELMEFSNQQFYGSRLQPIPTHPRLRSRSAPIRLYQVAGTYEERCNAAEAEQVVRIVVDLLSRPEPPSIGIACLNLTQRDLILDRLAEQAEADQDFRERLAAARTRVGSGAFEGLFVKNLENVQGDERDQMIISTTYGPDQQGRFFRRFGPLGQSGGGRRLNVLITRAREEVHLVTSIPASLYCNLPAVPAGQQPGGGWLLFAYLNYAELLGESYKRPGTEATTTQARVSAGVVEQPSRAPSQFAVELGRLVAKTDQLGSDIHWGNEGFCIDVAFHHPCRPEARTLGVMCDGTRFQNADDPVAWDVFRMAVLKDQGWQMRRVWSPEFFRDPEGSIRQLVAQAKRLAESDHGSEDPAPPPNEGQQPA